MPRINSSVLIDTNILLDIFTENPSWAGWSTSQMERAQRKSDLIINPIIYSELSIGFDKIETLERGLYVGGIKVKEVPREALFLAGKAFLKYRKNNGTKSITLPDFFIGAHAAVEKIPVLTRDPKRMKYYFPSLKVISPA